MCLILFTSCFISVIMPVNLQEVLLVAQSTYIIRMDNTLKKQFDLLCSDFGMTASTAFNVFAKAVVRQRKIPFEIVAEKTKISNADGYNAFMTLRSEAAVNGLQKLTLEDINEEISAARVEAKESYL